MKKYIFAILLLLNTTIFSDTKCFIASQDGVVIQEEGDCNTRHSPCSTFKIPLSVMGYDAGILIDELNPKWSFQEGYVDFRENWKQDHWPTNWMEHSCVWYSHVIARILGIEKFKDYVARFDYGNMDVSGKDALRRAWLSSSLKISGFEQIAFLEKLLDGALPTSQKSHELTSNILFIEDLNGWKLYGKTGSGDFVNDDGSKNAQRQIGWFIGWIRKDDQKIIFAHYVEDEKILDYSSGRMAKEEAKNKLLALIEKQ
jgi:beta-lactamase class D